MTAARLPCHPIIHKALLTGWETKVFPGGAAAIYWNGAPVHYSSIGNLQIVPEPIPIKNDVLFDLASLTKIIATTPAILFLIAHNQLSLDDRVTKFWPSFGAAGKHNITIRNLLAHNSGLPAWKPLFLPDSHSAGTWGNLLTHPLHTLPQRDILFQSAKKDILKKIELMPTEYSLGETSKYSDIGFIILGNVIELVSVEKLDSFVKKEIFSRWGLKKLFFHRLDEQNSARLALPIAATGLSRPREPADGQEKHFPPRLTFHKFPNAIGEVDDDHAFIMGGVAGHAGLFGTAQEVALFGQKVLEELAGAQRIAPVTLWKQFCQRVHPENSTRALGFDTPSSQNSSIGTFLSKTHAIGHLGFTGTSLWVSLDHSLVVALLTNRVHPTRSNQQIRTFRPFFHDAVVQALEL